MSFSSVRKCQRFFRLLESVVPDNDEPGFLNVAPNAALPTSEVFHRIHTLNEWRCDSAEKGSAGWQNEFDFPFPNRARRTALISVFRLRFLDVRSRVILRTDPAVIEWKKPNANALAAFDDRRLVNYVDSIVSLAFRQLEEGLSFALAWPGEGKLGECGEQARASSAEAHPLKTLMWTGPFGSGRLAIGVRSVRFMENFVASCAASTS